MTLFRRPEPRIRVGHVRHAGEPGGIVPDRRLGGRLALTVFAVWMREGSDGFGLGLMDHVALLRAALGVTDVDVAGIARPLPGSTARARRATDQCCGASWLDAYRVTSRAGRPAAHRSARRRRKTGSWSPGCGRAAICRRWRGPPAGWGGGRAGRRPGRPCAPAGRPARRRLPDRAGAGRPARSTG